MNNIKSQIQVNESTLNETERLGLAWCRLNMWEWDDYLPRPKGFDQLPHHPKYISWPIRWRVSSKLTQEDYIIAAMKNIEGSIGPAYTSMCWWRFALKKSYAEWKDWYFQLYPLSPLFFS